MSTTNHDRIGKALDLLRQGLKPFVEREMQAALGDPWATSPPWARRRLPAAGYQMQAPGGAENRPAGAALSLSKGPCIS